MDVLFINPGSAKDVYQGLSTDYSGIGTPYWLLLLSQSCRSKGYDVGVLDVFYICCTFNIYMVCE